MVDSKFFQTLGVVFLLLQGPVLPAVSARRPHSGATECSCVTSCCCMRQHGASTGEACAAEGGKASRVTRAELRRACCGHAPMSIDAPAAAEYLLGFGAHVPGARSHSTRVTLDGSGCKSSFAGPPPAPPPRG